MRMLKTAIASTPPARDTALLIPDARPLWRESTAFITVVVSGATVIVMPMPSVTIAGKTEIQYEPPTPIMAKIRNATPTTAGPTVSGNRAPNCPISPPAHREPANMISANGSTAAPAAVAP